MSRLASSEPLESRTLLSVQLVADLNTTPGSSDPANAVQVNGVTIFIADDNAHGREVWRTDGTPEGTSLLRDVVVGPDTSNPVILGTAGGGEECGGEDSGHTTSVDLEHGKLLSGERKCHRRGGHSQFCTQEPKGGYTPPLNAPVWRRNHLEGEPLGYWLSKMRTRLLPESTTPR